MWLCLLKSLGSPGWPMWLILCYSQNACTKGSLKQWVYCKGRWWEGGVAVNSAIENLCIIIIIPGEKREVWRGKGGVTGAGRSLSLEKPSSCFCINRKWWKEKQEKHDFYWDRDEVWRCHFQAAPISEGCSERVAGNPGHTTGTLVASYKLIH